MTSPDLASFVTGYFVRHLAAERNVSAHTTAAYRDTLKLLLRFARDRRPPTRRGAPVRGSDAGADPAISRSLGDRSTQYDPHAQCTAGGDPQLWCGTSPTASPPSPSRASGSSRFPSRRRRVRCSAISRKPSSRISWRRWTGRPTDGERDYLLLALLYDTGARIQELLGSDRDGFSPRRPALRAHPRERPS